jgi:periplasmic divalent cation tolerance protein
VNILGGVKSRYWWKGKIEKDDESLLVLKTEDSRVPEVIAALNELHPYDTPELLSLPVESGAEAYLRWVSEETGDRPADAP